MSEQQKKKKIDSWTKKRWERVAYNLRRLRQSKGIDTVNDLLDAMGNEMIEVNPSYMRRLESANAPFGSEMEQRFAQFYKVDISEFYKPIAKSEKEKAAEAVKKELLRLEIEQIIRIRDLIPVLFGGESGKEEQRKRSEDLSVSSAGIKKSA